MQAITHLHSAGCVLKPFQANVPGRRCPSHPAFRRQVVLVRKSTVTGLGIRNQICRAEGSGSALTAEFRKAIDDFVEENKVVAFIKGTKEFPMCGFSNTVVQILNACGVPYTTVNVLDSDIIRSGMKEYSAWPTFPQIYIGGEFFGGCDIVLEAYNKGELIKVLDAVVEEAQ